MQDVAVLLGILAAGVFSHSWLLRRSSSCLFECWLVILTLQPSFLSSLPPPPPPIILCLVSLDKGDADCLIITSASPRIVSKLKLVRFLWKWSAVTSPAASGSFWLPVLSLSLSTYSVFSISNWHHLLFNCLFPIILFL